MSGPAHRGAAVVRAFARLGQLGMLCTLSWATGPQALAAETLADCRIAGLRNSVKCGVLQRALDPARPDGTKIDVHYVVVPAIARRKLPDPVFLLAGGPGQSAIELAPAMMGLLNRLANRRDIVFVDQRGTGRSNPLECKPARDEALADAIDPDRQVRQLAQCRAELLAQGRIKAPDELRFFTTVLAMQDLDAVRQQLGAQRINLVGASYGTRAALEYQRRFPVQVRRSVLDGVAPPDMVLPATFAADGQAAFDNMLAACEAEPACAANHPRLRADWAALLAGLPRPVAVPHPLTGRTERFELTRDMLLAAVRGPLYSPSLAAGLPAAIGEAARGNFTALMGLSALLSSRRGGQVAMGMHFSVICAEDMPLLERGAVTPAASAASAAQAPAAAASAQVLLPMPAADADADADANAFLRLYTRVCADWPRGAVPTAFYSLPASTSPVLLLGGGLDPATPPRHGERVAQALGPLALHVVVPNAGHGVMGLGCMRDVIYRFIDAADDKDAAAALPADAACARNIPRPPAFQPVAGSGAPAR